MILVDTSVWVDFFSRTATIHGDRLTRLIETSQPLCINGLIEMELLQGIREQHIFEEVRRFLGPFRYSEGIQEKHLAKAVEIYRNCRSQGKTIRKSSDCIITAQAILEQHILFSLDRDFVHISQVYPNLILL